MKLVNNIKKVDLLIKMMNSSDTSIYQLDLFAKNKIKSSGVFKIIKQLIVCMCMEEKI